MNKKLHTIYMKWQKFHIDMRVWDKEAYDLYFELKEFVTSQEIRIEKLEEELIFYKKQYTDNLTKRSNSIENTDSSEESTKSTGRSNG